MNVSARRCALGAGVSRRAAELPWPPHSSAAKLTLPPGAATSCPQDTPALPPGLLQQQGRQPAVHPLPLQHLHRHHRQDFLPGVVSRALVNSVWMGVSAGMVAAGELCLHLEAPRPAEGSMQGCGGSFGSNAGRHMLAAMGAPLGCSPASLPRACRCACAHTATSPSFSLPVQPARHFDARPVGAVHLPGAAAQLAAPYAGQIISCMPHSCSLSCGKPERVASYMRAGAACARRCARLAAARARPPPTHLARHGAQAHILPFYAPSHPLLPAPSLAPVSFSYAPARAPALMSGSRCQLPARRGLTSRPLPAGIWRRAGHVVPPFLPAPSTRPVHRQVLLYPPCPLQPRFSETTRAGMSRVLRCELHLLPCLGGWRTGGGGGSQGGAAAPAHVSRISHTLFRSFLQCERRWTRRPGMRTMGHQPQSRLLPAPSKRRNLRSSPLELAAPTKPYTKQHAPLKVGTWPKRQSHFTSSRRAAIAWLWLLHK